MEENYERLYLKYKAKYLELKNTSGGMFPIQTKVSQSERKKARKEAERARRREQEEAAAASIREFDEEIGRREISVQDEGDSILRLIYNSINPNLNNFNWYSKDYRESTDLLNTLAYKIRRLSEELSQKTRVDRDIFEYVTNKLKDRREKLRSLSALFEIRQSESSRRYAARVSEILRGSEPEASQLLMDSLQQPMAPQDRARVIQPEQIPEPIRVEPRGRYITPAQARRQRARARAEREEERRLYGKYDYN